MYCYCYAMRRFSFCFTLLVFSLVQHVRRAAVLALSTAAHNKPNLIKGLLPELLPLLYDQTIVKVTEAAFLSGWFSFDACIGYSLISNFPCIKCLDELRFDACWLYSSIPKFDLYLLSFPNFNGNNKSVKGSQRPSKAHEKQIRKWISRSICCRCAAAAVLCLSNICPSPFFYLRTKSIGMTQYSLLPLLWVAGCWCSGNVSDVMCSDLAF